LPRQLRDQHRAVARFGDLQNGRQQHAFARRFGDASGQYDPTFTHVPQTEQSHASDDWKPIVGTPFVESSRGGDDGIRRVLEMVRAAVRF
jgi:hypothetical protein